MESANSRVNSVPLSRERLFVGLGILGFCLVAFVTQTEVTQYLQKNLNFKSPYFILWFSHSFYMLVFPLDLMFRKFTGRSNFTRTLENIQSEVEGLERELEIEPHPVRGSLFSFGKAVSIIAVILTAGAYLWYVAVGLTSMASLTAIYNTSCFFAYIFSMYGGLEVFSVTKILSVILSIGGVVIISAFDTESVADERRSTLIGNGVAIISAVLIGLFEVVYKKRAVSVKNPTALMANFVTSYIGMVTFALLWLPLPFLHFTNIEPFSLPGRDELPLLIVNALMGVLYNAGLMLLISITSPVFASVGVMTTIPLIALVDSMLSQQPLPAHVWLGGVIIAAAFLLLTRATLQEHNEDLLRQKDVEEGVENDMPSLVSPRRELFPHHHMPLPTEDTPITTDQRK